MDLINRHAEASQTVQDLQGKKILKVSRRYLKTRRKLRFLVFSSSPLPSTAPRGLACARPRASRSLISCQLGKSGRKSRLLFARLPSFTAPAG